MERPIRGPDLDRPYLDSKEAAAWLGIGIGEKTFEALMALHLPTVRPVRLGKRKAWAWADCAVLGYVLTRASEGSASPEESEEE